MKRSLPNEAIGPRSSWLGDTMGSSTGEGDRAVQAGGWAGTDDATSTAPSDELGNPARGEDQRSFNAISRDLDASLLRDEEEQKLSAEAVDEASEQLSLGEQIGRKPSKPNEIG